MERFFSELPTEMFSLRHLAMGGRNLYCTLVLTRTEAAALMSNIHSSQIVTVNNPSWLPAGETF
jgi:hypothetical protein